MKINLFSQMNSLNYPITSDKFRIYNKYFSPFFVFFFFLFFYLKNTSHEYSDNVNDIRSLNINIPTY